MNTNIDRTGLTAHRNLRLLVFFVAAIILQKLFYNVIQSKGVIITGDEPSYIMQAQALSHFTLHILPTIRHDLATNVFPKTYPPHTTVNMVERFNGPTGVVSPFAPGLGALLLVFVVILGPVTGAVLGMICLNTAGLIWLHQRVSKLFGISWMAQGVMAIAFAMPAVFLAINQIFPDLPAGILLAIGLVEIAFIESEQRPSRTSLVLITVSVAVVPWLQPKNLLPAVIILLAFTFTIGWRKGGLGPAGIAVIGISLLSFLLFFLYNHHYYDHWLGLPEPSPTLNRAGVEYTLGLLFDRDVGLFVQVPYCLIALADLIAFGWRQLPAAIIATVISFLGILFLNGTYVSNPYGGLSLAGRFMWTLIPLCLPWSALVLKLCLDRSKTLRIPLTIVLLSWLYQAARPIFTHYGGYYNPLIVSYHPWPTWWIGFGDILPQFGHIGLYLGTPTWALPVELIIEASVIAGILYWLRVPRSKFMVSPGAHLGPPPRNT